MRIGGQRGGAWVSVQSRTGITHCKPCIRSPPALQVPLRWVSAGVWRRSPVRAQGGVWNVSFARTARLVTKPLHNSVHIKSRVEPKPEQCRVTDNNHQPFQPEPIMKGENGIEQLGFAVGKKKHASYQLHHQRLLDIIVRVTTKSSGFTSQPTQ